VLDRLIERHGLALVFANVLLEQVGLPLPAVPTLIVCGALAAEGRISAAAVLGLAFLACAIGDGLWFLAGRFYGRRVLRFLCGISLSPDSCVRQTQTQFERWGGIALVAAKFIPGLSTVAPPLAGAMRYGWVRFTLLNSLGILVWAGVAIGAGMLFHAQVSALLARLEDLGRAAVGLVVALLCAYVAFKWWERQRLYKTLRVARITVDELRKLMGEAPKPVIVDLRAQLPGDERRSIPGAIVMDLAEVRDGRSGLPLDNDIVFFCDCPNEASAASAAKGLMDLGYTRVRPLLGGLDAWIAAGYELAPLLPTEL
jgi:membrane protein DedA with SNARE-associated domain/rhodanese-related sulfurtransferase